MPFYSNDNNGNGFTSIPDLMGSIIADLTEVDYDVPATTEVISPSTPLVAKASGSAAFRDITAGSPMNDGATMEAFGCDPLWTDIDAPSPNDVPSGFQDNQNWRIQLIQNSVGDMVLRWGTGSSNDANSQLVTDNTVNGSTPEVILLDVNSIGINTVTDDQLPQTKFTYKYNLVTSDRGFALAVIALGQENNARYCNSVCIQRPTNPISGAIKDTPKAPVFAVSTQVIDRATIVADSSFVSLFANHDEAQAERPSAVSTDDFGLYPVFQYGLVRDEIIQRSETPLIPLGNINRRVRYTFDFEWHQPPQLDNFNHVIKFPFGLSSTRHIYLEELDLLGLVYAGSFPPEQTSTIDLYTPSQTRTYHATYGHYGVVGLNDLQPAGTGPFPPDGFKFAQPWSRIVLLRDGDAVTGLNDHS